ncbi:hypothetical protein FN846DRAFT_895646 [Sphaerosporella brunnea]|uniref:Ubiquitin 3 binding protein But2 C-terminal domain-containing protein n=1 Tax=Sphaerosporella brunnea TaxID=1250544 RepID=A0A5J5EEJ6_9PEZI|nr:hypothetical protein FN846DRAFT_895646 [Sphaerosporella brunnea]
MQFSINSVLLLAAAAFSAALPTSSIDSVIEKRQNRNIRITPSALVRMYEHSPNLNFAQDGWGETSSTQAGDGRATSVNTLVSFKLEPEDGGRTCNLRFNDPNFATGSKTFSIFNFVPSNGVTFDASKATWNQRTGHRDQQAATYTHGAGTDIIYSFTCPSGGKYLNYELAASRGEVNIQWYSPHGEGMWLEVVIPPNTPVKPPTGSKPVATIPIKDQVQLFEARPDAGQGSAQFGEVSWSSSKESVSTLVGFVMPDTDYTGRTCALKLFNPTAATGSKSFALFEFIPYGGEVIFKSWLATWNSKTGYRKRELATYKVGGDKPIYSFPCPKPKTGISYDLVPIGGEVSIKWDSSLKKTSGFQIEVL